MGRFTISMSFLNYQRLDNIVNLLLDKKESVHIDELCSYCNVSDRTIRSDINMINDYIRNHGAHIVLLRKKGYTIEYLDQNTFDEFWSHQDTGTFLFTTSETRLIFLIRVFLTADDFIGQEYLQSILFVSQNTLYNDLRSLKEILNQYNLKLQNKSNLGYKLIGKEQDLRSATIDLIFKSNFNEYLTASTSVEKDICNNIDYNLFRNLYETCFSTTLFIDSDYFHRNIFTNLLLTTSRVKAGYTLINFDKKIRLKQQFIPVIDCFTTKIEKQFHITLSDIEKSYINFCIAENSPSLIDDIAVNENQETAQNILKVIHNTLQTLTDADWINDKRLHSKLLEHIKLFLKIQTIEGNRTNPIFDTVKNNFPYAFDLAISCCSEIVKTYDVHFSEDEISYIALHLTNAIEHNNQVTHKQVSLAIICGTGRTFSSIIEAKIKRRFQNVFSNIEKHSYSSYSSLKEKSKKFDIVVSTVPIRKNAIDIIFIDINDLDSSMNQIEQELNKLNENKSESLFSSKHFQIMYEKSNKEKVLMHLHKELFSQGFVKENFLSELFEREEISSTIISESIAIPHPLGNAVIRSTIFPVIAPKGIMWDGKLIKFVFLFAIKAEESEKMENIYEYLLDFISSEQLQTKILKNPTFDAILSIFGENN